VLVPVYDEEATVAVLQHVLEQRPVQELIVVDDASGDKTWEQLQQFAGTEPRLKLFRHQQNQGKGAALRTAIQHATAPVVIIQDADFEYDPSEYYVLLNPILSGKADVVFGSRFIGSSAHRVLYFWHSVVAAGFQIVRLSYFNLPGYFAWWLNFHFFEKADVRAGESALVPAVHFSRDPSFGVTVDSAAFRPKPAGGGAGGRGENGDGTRSRT
jgi:glycosyltransferase involved in cell wall biosynthesis